MSNKQLGPFRFMGMCVVAMALTSCSRTPDALLGKWQIGDKSMIQVREFKADGTETITAGGMENDGLNMRVELKPSTVKYRINGDELVEDGTFQTYESPAFKIDKSKRNNSDRTTFSVKGNTLNLTSQAGTETYTRVIAETR